MRIKTQNDTKSQNLIEKARFRADVSAGTVNFKCRATWWVGKPWGLKNGFLFALEIDTSCYSVVEEAYV